jgi:hypothetical protein
MSGKKSRILGQCITPTRSHFLLNKSLFPLEGFGVSE